MKLRKAYILLIILSLALVSCDEMFSEWVGESAGKETMPKWNLVDPLNYQDPLIPVKTMNIDRYAATSYPSLAVQYETLFASWIEGSTIHVRQYNGDDDNPLWYTNTDIYLTAPTGAVLCPSQYGMLVGFVDNGGLNVQSISSEMLGTYIHYTAAVPGNVNLLEFNGMVHAVWEEGGFIRMKRYNGNYIWDSSVEDTYGFGINDTNIPVSNCRARAADGWLYVVFVEQQTSPQLKVRRYNGMNWETVNSTLNYYYMGTSGLNFPDIAKHDNEPFIAWLEYDSIEGYSYNRLNVRSVWGRWIDGFSDSNYDGVPEYNKGIKWADSGSAPQYVNCVDINGNLCVLWVEQYYDPVSMIDCTSIRANLYDGSWTFVDGNGPCGIGVGGYPSELRAVKFGNSVALIFLDTITGNLNAHVMVGR